MKSSKQRREQRKRAKMRAIVQQKPLANCDCDLCTELRIDQYEEMTMNITPMNPAPIPTDEKQRDYLLGRLGVIKDQLVEDGRKFFHLTDEEGPHNPKELIDRIVNGRYEFKKGYDDPEETRFTYPWAWIRWRDPKNPADIEGFNKWRDEVLSKLYQDARDAIVIKTPEEGLKILQDFASTTIQ
jgi:hypothetical protein